MQTQTSGPLPNTLISNGQVDTKDPENLKICGKLNFVLQRQKASISVNGTRDDASRPIKHHDVRRKGFQISKVTFTHSLKVIGNYTTQKAT